MGMLLRILAILGGAIIEDLASTLNDVVSSMFKGIGFTFGILAVLVFLSWGMKPRHETDTQTAGWCASAIQQPNH